MTDPVDSLAGRPDMLQVAARYAVAATRSCPWLRDDAISAAYLGLAQAESTYDPALGASWKSHAKRRVYGAVVDLLRTESRSGFWWAGRGQSIKVESLSPECDPGSTDDGPSRIDDADEAEFLLGLLPPTERLVTTKAYGDGLPLKRAGASIGLSPSWSALLATRAVERLRRRLSGGPHDPNA